MAWIVEFWKQPLEEATSALALGYPNSSAPGFSRGEAVAQMSLKLYQVSPLATTQVGLAAQLNGFLGTDGLLIANSPSLALWERSVSLDGFFDALDGVVGVASLEIQPFAVLKSLAVEARSRYGFGLFMFPTDMAIRSEILSGNAGANPHMDYLLATLVRAFAAKGFPTVGFSAFVAATCSLDQPAIWGRIRNSVLPSFRFDNCADLGTPPEVDVPDSGEVKFSPKGQPEVVVALSLADSYLASRVISSGLTLEGARLVTDFRLRLFSALWPSVIPMPSKDGFSMRLTV